jgi:hypothetical protein
MLTAIVIAPRCVSQGSSPNMSVLIIGSLRAPGSPKLIEMAPVLAFNVGATVAFALLAFTAQRKGHQIIGAILAAAAWSFLAFSVVVWLSQ